EIVIEVWSLQQRTDLPALCRRAWLTKPEEVTVVGLQHIEDDAKQCGLPATVRAENAKDTSFGNGEGNLVQCPYGAVKLRYLREREYRGHKKYFEMQSKIKAVEITRFW